MKYPISLTALALAVLLSFPVVATPDGKEIQYLSGTGSDDTRTWEFYCTTGRNSGHWTTIEVPSHWEQQGFGEYDYGRDYRTYGRKFRFADEKGLYRHTFRVPPAWKGKKVKIVFEGSMTDTEVKINGHPAGEIHQGAFYRFSYDITGMLKFGDVNLLEVTVSKMSADASVNRAERYADYWVFGGIFRPVYLEACPAEHVERAAINAGADGTFEADLVLQGIKGACQAEAVILDQDQQPVATLTTPVESADTLVTLRGKVENPLTWSAETPHLYTVRITLKRGRKNLYTLTESFGFRTIEIRQGDGIYINGIKVKMKGINRHAFWPETGRCLNDRINLEDVRLMKWMNMNAVRCAHYPPDKAFLHICDSLGLYVLDELAGWQNAYSTAVGEKLVREMVLRDVNHPSIIFWSNGNEGGTNKELDDDFGRWDPSGRPVIHAHHRPGNDFNGIDCNHYENYYSSRKILGEGKIYMPTEFLHAQDDGGGGAGLADFWELFWNTPNSGGGFLWALVDEGVVRTDLGGFIDANRVNGPDGVVGPHREKEGSAYAIREIFCPVKIALPELPGTFNGTIPIENRYHFTDLSACRFEWQLVDFSTVTDRQPFHSVAQSGTAVSPAIPPLETGFLTIALPAGYDKHDALYLKVFDPTDHEIYCYSRKINGNKKALEQMVFTTPSEQQRQLRERLRAQGVEEDNILPIERQAADMRRESAAPEILETDTLITLKASGIAVTFSKTDGTIRWINNDLGLPIPFGQGPLPVSGKARFNGFLQFSTPEYAALTMNYTGDLKQVTWKMYPGGWLEMNYEYFLENSNPFAGISFTFPESDIIGVKWLGNGPAHVWKNRMTGGVLDVWQRFYNNRLPGDNHWGPPQFKGYYDDVSWMEFNTVDGKFTVVAAEEKLFVRLFDFHGLSGPRHYPALPSGNLSFLDAIPPVGTKLAMGISNDTWNLGPAGEMNTMKEPVRRTLFFYFGIF
ncbi:MAG: glycoside hydrolase family 2 [Bacteroidales bacterium]|nr:glycoside hydrolase family 2 [Bacteroidales bacterium]